MTSLNSKIIETLNLPPLDGEQPTQQPDLPQDFDKDSEKDNAAVLAEANEFLDKIDKALPQVTELDNADAELDSLSDLAKDKFHDLMDLGMSVEPKYAKDIFNAASTLLGHSITAKTNKIEKKLRMVELQIKKQRLDQDDKNSDKPKETPGDYQYVDRNALLEDVLNAAKKKA